MGRIAKGLTLVAAIVAANAAMAQGYEPSWPDLKDALYGDSFLTPAGDLIAIDAPYRSEMDSRTQIGAKVTAPEGRMLESVTVILDENPMPVSAVFTFSKPVPRFFFDVTMRVNGPTPLHIVAKTSEGQLLMAESFVKTSGQGACSAPPGTDPDLALATLGNMVIEVAEFGPEAGNIAAVLGSSTGHGPSFGKKMDLDIDHPSHSGMQMDQISLLFIPSRYVDQIDIDLDGVGYVDVTGSISLSENPKISLSVPSASRSVDVTLMDTDGTVTKAHKSLPGF